MKVSFSLLTLTAGTALAAPVAEPGAIASADAEAEAALALVQRDGPSLTTYAVGGFRVSAVSAVIKPWTVFTPTTGNSVSFTVQPLSASYQNLGSPITCTKTWEDSLLKSTGSAVVKCSNPNMSIYTSRNFLAATEFNVYMQYTLTRTANSTAGTQYNAKFTLNEKSVQLKCTQDKSKAQNCVSSGTGLLSSTLSSKSVS
ncbi:hypothetical protein C1H76_3071 [Elsinoe australis]|uniref:AA1-like domain-containing protein n=1 Tax=Elsinoe australis TaxID=40998 RepID=A0A4U7B8I9_9PEZI|nr:hypothetical protein C1H76_3071 [Elsinoe australis]